MRIPLLKILLFMPIHPSIHHHLHIHVLVKGHGLLAGAVVLQTLRMRAKEPPSRLAHSLAPTKRTRLGRRRTRLGRRRTRRYNVVRLFHHFHWSRRTVVIWTCSEYMNQWHTSHDQASAHGPTFYEIKILHIYVTQSVMMKI